MAIIKSGASSDQLTVDVTSKAARVTSYDSLGNYRGPKRTYRAATLANVVAAASAQPFFVIEGSATTVVIVHRIRVSGPTLTAVAYNTVEVAKYSTAVTGGTAVNLTAVPLDSNSVAATLGRLSVYTAAPTQGTLVGVVDAQRVLLQATTAAAAGIPDFWEFDYRTLPGETTGIYLRGASQGLGLRFGAAPATAVTLAVSVEWTEE